MPKKLNVQKHLYINSSIFVCEFKTKNRFKIKQKKEEEERERQNEKKQKKSKTFQTDRGSFFDKMLSTNKT